MRINISIDDVTPHPRSSTRVLRRCFEILERVPMARFTLFIPTAYWRTVGPTSTAEPLNISQFPEFCDEIRALPKESFEVGYHGHHHGIPGVSNNDELWHDGSGGILGHDAALGIIGNMMEEVTKARMFDVFKPILRPPAWRMAPDAFDAAREMGIKLFALSSDEYARVTYAGKEGTQTSVFYNACPPQKPLKPLNRIEVVYHSCEWDVNYLSEARRDELIDFLLQHPAEHVFIEGLLG